MCKYVEYVQEQSVKKLVQYYEEDAAKTTENNQKICGTSISKNVR